MARKVRTTGARKDAAVGDVLRARLTSKGQLTVPVEVRRLYDLKPGDELAFRVAEDALQVTPIRRRLASSFLGALPATRRYPGPQAMKRLVTSAKTRHYRRKQRAPAPSRSPRRGSARTSSSGSGATIPRIKPPGHGGSCAAPQRVRSPCTPHT